jgi:hypothetical protein
MADVEEMKCESCGRTRDLVTLGGHTLCRLAGNCVDRKSKLPADASPSEPQERGRISKDDVDFIKSMVFQGPDMTDRQERRVKRIIDEMRLLCVLPAAPTAAGSEEPKLQSIVDVKSFNVAAPVASQAPALEPGRTVRVDDPRFHGEGIVQYLVPPRPAYVGVRLQNGNVWEYEATKVQQIFGTLPANHWTNRQKKSEANHE